MKVLNGILLKHLFTVICIIGAVIMVGYWFYKFDVEDRDIGVVDYVPVEDISDAEIPVPTLCFQNPFLPERLSEISEYIEYMKGDVFRNESENIDYGNVTLSLNNYLMFSKIKWRNGSIITYGSTHVRQKEIFNGWYAHAFFKCFEVSSNIRGRSKIESIYFYYKRKEIMRDTKKHDGMRYYINMNYPGQFLLTPGPMSLSYIGNDNKSTTLWINDIEILKSRNSRNRKCTPIDDIGSFDDMVLEKHIGINGCRAPYMKPFKGYPLCDTEEKMTNCIYSYRIARKNYYASACQRLSKIRFGKQYINQDPKYTDGIPPTDIFAVGIIYSSEYARIITQSKEVDIHSLVGNIGGYVGLFLGNIFPFIQCVYQNTYLIKIIYCCIKTLFHK